MLMQPPGRPRPAKMLTELLKGVSLPSTGVLPLQIARILGELSPKLQTPGELHLRGGVIGETSLL